MTSTEQSSDILWELTWNTSLEQRENMAAVPGSSSENETRFDRALNLINPLAVAMLRRGNLGSKLQSLNPE